MNFGINYLDLLYFVSVCQFLACNSLSLFEADSEALEDGTLLLCILYLSFHFFYKTVFYARAFKILAWSFFNSK